MKLHSRRSVVFGSFCSILCQWDWSTLLCAAVISFSALLWSSQLYECATTCIFGEKILWLLGIKLTQIFLYLSFVEMSIGVELLDHRIYVRTALLDSMVFKVILPLTLPSAIDESSNCHIYNLTNTRSVSPFNLSHSGPGIAVLMWISLTINDGENLY